MNYINPESMLPQELRINTLGTPTDSISWTIQLEGSKESTHLFATPSATANFEDLAYYQKLTVDLRTLGINLQDSTQYTLKGTKNGDTIYFGKLYTTTQNVAEIKVNGDNFVSPDISNEFIII